MIGFIKKDLAMIKSNFKLIGILLIIYTIMGLSNKMDISFILPFISVLLMISTFSYDAFNKWDAYSISFPDGRKNGVKSKYLATLFMILVVAILTTLLSIIIAYKHEKSLDYEAILLPMLGNILGTLMVLSWMYPIIYKLGMEKARIGLFILIFGVIIIVEFLSQYINFSIVFNEFSFLNNYWVITFITIGMLYLSYKISLRIQLKKEF